MKLQRYFDRIGYSGSVAPTIETLNALHEAHVRSVPFENLDVQLGRTGTLDVDAARDKIVARRRGGWCYEQNGLFGRVLSEIGFNIERVAGAVMRQARGAWSLGDHLFLLVRDPHDEDKRLLADVGFGCSLTRPIPLTESTRSFAPFDLGLRRLDDGHWQFWENDGGGEFSFDFLPGMDYEAVLAERCAVQQTRPDSPFVLSLVAQIRTADGHQTLRGRVLKSLTTGGATNRVLQSPDELLETLNRIFDLDVPEIADLWPRICARHATLFGAD